jgi:hypothetical protein
MSNYVQSTNFATKDALPSGDPLKIVKGTEINTEFNNIAVAVATKADLISPTFTGTPVLPTGTTGVTQGAGNNSTALATTAYADAAITAERTATATLTNKSLTSPTLTGTPVAPTASVDTNTTQVATTAFVVAQIADDAPTKTGTGASGSWGIDVTGSAANLSTASGSAPSYSARAWVNFNGTGTVAIRASGNVSSVTDNGTGDYTVNFATAMSDSNYVGVTSGDNQLGGGFTNTGQTTVNRTRTASAFGFTTGTGEANRADFDGVFVLILR